MSLQAVRQSQHPAHVAQQVPSLLPRTDLGEGSGIGSCPAADRFELPLINTRHIMKHAGELSEEPADRARVRLRWAGHVHGKAK